MILNASTAQYSLDISPSRPPQTPANPSLPAKGLIWNSYFSRISSLPYATYRGDACADSRAFQKKLSPALFGLNMGFRFVASPSFSTRGA